MRALAATGRTADALAAYERLRDRLADELGVDPGAELQALQLAVLRGEIAAESATRRAAASGPSAQQPAGVADQLHRPGGRGGQGVRAARQRPAGHHRRAGWGRKDQAGQRDCPAMDPAPLRRRVVGRAGAGDGRRRPSRRRCSAPSGCSTPGRSSGGSSGPTRDTTEHLFDVLAEADCVLLVDNCEHLIGPVAALIDQLLARCPDVRILTTSREPLGIVGEALCVLPPLGLPPVGCRRGGCRRLSGGAAAGRTRAGGQRRFRRRRRPRSTHVTEIVRRLDGLPLAIELAAARLRVMPIGEIAARLSDRFRLLTGGSRTAMPRHRTLRAVVEWSWDLLGTGRTAARGAARGVPGRRDRGQRGRRLRRQPAAGSGHRRSAARRWWTSRC